MLNLVLTATDNTDEISTFSVNVRLGENTYSMIVISSLESRLTRCIGRLIVHDTLSDETAVLVSARCSGVSRVGLRGVSKICKFKWLVKVGASIVSTT